MDDTGERRFAAWNIDRRTGGFSERMLAIWLRSKTKCSYLAAYKSMAESPDNITLEHLVAAVRAQITRDLRARSDLKVVGSGDPVPRRWKPPQPQPLRSKKPRNDVRRIVVNGSLALDAWLTPQDPED